MDDNSFMHEQGIVNTELVHFAKKTAFEISGNYEWRLYTQGKANVYNTSDLKQNQIVRTEPQGKLIPYNREVIRNRINMFKVKSSGEYMEKGEGKAVKCSLCKVSGAFVDILLMSHDDFEAYVVDKRVVNQVMKGRQARDIESTVIKTPAFTSVQTKDQHHKDGKTLVVMNTLKFKPNDVDIKIGRLYTNDKFFIADSATERKARKIVTADGTEGILLSRENSFEIVPTPLKKTVNVIVRIITVLSILGEGVH